MIPQEYTIGSSGLVIKINPFLQTNVCNYDLTYTLSISGGGLFPNFISGAFSPQMGGTVTV